MARRFAIAAGMADRKAGRMKIRDIHRNYLSAGWNNDGREPSKRGTARTVVSLTVQCSDPRTAVFERSLLSPDVVFYKADANGGVATPKNGKTILESSKEI